MEKMSILNKLVNNMTRLQNDYKGSFSLFSVMYRGLITKGRTYACFDYETLKLLGSLLENRREILDPMSGYGTLMTYCANTGKKAYLLEINPPAFLWQYLIHPSNKDLILTIIHRFISKVNECYAPNVRAECSDEWLTEEAINISISIYQSLCKITSEFITDKILIEQTALSILLPFVFRISTSINGDTAFVKKGGICVYYNYKTDLNFYLKQISAMLYSNLSISQVHTINLGDCRDNVLPLNRFEAMITSPPYPNYRDYRKMFGPENYLLDQFEKRKLISFSLPQNNVIGTNKVKGREADIINNPVVNNFLDKLCKYKGTKKAEIDNARYYVPYFRNYFYDMELAYENIAKSLANKFEGYIIVTNNTVRNFIVPVAESIIYKWNSMGYNAEEFKSTEKFHVGTKNPHTKGLKAKHSEYIIKVWK